MEVKHFQNKNAAMVQLIIGTLRSSSMATKIRIVSIQTTVELKSVKILKRDLTKVALI